MAGRGTVTGNRASPFPLVVVAYPDGARTRPAGGTSDACPMGARFELQEIDGHSLLGRKNCADRPVLLGAGTCRLVRGRFGTSVAVWSGEGGVPLRTSEKRKLVDHAPAKYRGQGSQLVFHHLPNRADQLPTGGPSKHNYSMGST